MTKIYLKISNRQMLYKSARSQWVNSLEAGDGIFFDRLLGVNTMPADALAPNVASASAVMILAV